MRWPARERFESSSVPAIRTEEAVCRPGTTEEISGGKSGNASMLRRMTNSVGKQVFSGLQVALERMRHSPTTAVSPALAAVRVAKY
jgi:hypothetical protein